MKIHEYQGKQILKKFGVTVPRGIHCTTVDDAVKAAETLGYSHMDIISGAGHDACWMNRVIRL